MGLGTQSYFGDPWNVFDFGLVLVSALDTVILLATPVSSFALF